MFQSPTLLPDLLAIAKDAGQAILEVYNSTGGQTEVDYKADNSPLTQADRASHNVIADRLKGLDPEIPILSEEGREIPYEERRNWNRFWLIDPLDGTKEFIKRNGEFTVNIALIEDQRPVVGVVHVPVSGESYAAIKGLGAFSYQEGDPKPILAQRYAADQTGLRIVCSRSHMSAEVEAFVKQFSEPTTVSMGSSLKFILVARGDADIYPRLAPTMEWDTAAAQIIVEEAGGRVINHETGKPLIYNKENLLNPHFVVYARETE